MALYGFGLVHEERGEIADAVRDYRAFLEKVQEMPPPPLGREDFGPAPWIDHAREFVSRHGH
jgi:hypothetical protein